MKTNAAIAKQAAWKIWNDLTDRRGVKWELNKCDDDVKQGIREAHAKIIAAAIREVLDKPRKRG